MKHFMDWVCEEEGKEVFYNTEVYTYAEMASNYIDHACSDYYLDLCGVKAGNGEFSYDAYAKYSMEQARDAMRVVWEWYGDYRDWCGEEGIKPESLWSVAMECTCRDIVHNTMCNKLVIMFRMMATMDDKVNEG